MKQIRSLSTVFFTSELHCDVTSEKQLHRVPDFPFPLIYTFYFLMAWEQMLWGPVLVHILHVNEAHM